MLFIAWSSVLIVRMHRREVQQHARRFGARRHHASSSREQRPRRRSSSSTSQALFGRLLRAGCASARVPLLNTFSLAKSARCSRTCVVRPLACSAWSSSIRRRDVKGSSTRSSVSPERCAVCTPTDGPRVQRARDRPVDSSPSKDPQAPSKLHHQLIRSRDARGPNRDARRRKIERKPHCS